MLNIDEDQKRAAEHFRGPCLVLAGPGSGKTTVIANRVLTLIEKYAVKPENILVVTFSRAAAIEMKERFLKLYNEGYRNPGVDFGTFRAHTSFEPQPVNPGVDFGTFHALAFRILRLYKGYTTDCIIREEERDALILQKATDLEINEISNNEILKNIVAEIGYVKGNGIPLENYYSPNCGADVFRELYNYYNSWLRRRKKIDFEDMLSEALSLFDERSEILQAFRKRYKFILVDEFQDINPLQYEFVKKLAAPENNLFAVGDDDQSIYGFRGASPEIMLGFGKDFEGAEVITLLKNYRSSGEIVACAGRLIAHNKKRYKKKTYAAKGSDELEEAFASGCCGKEKGVDVFEEAFESGCCGKENKRTEAGPSLRTPAPAVSIRSFPNTDDENAEIIRLIKAYGSAGVKYGKMAVLYRTNNGARALLRKLTDHGIPFNFRENLPGIMSHWITRDILTYIRIAAGSTKRSDWLSIINKPNRFISREAFSSSDVDFKDVYEYYDGKEYVLERFENLFFDLGYIDKMNPYAAFSYIRHAIGYDTYITEYARNHHADEEVLFEVLDELTESAKGFATVDEWKAHMEKYEKELKRKATENGTSRSAGAAQYGSRNAGAFEVQKNRAPVSDNLEEGVTITTYHASKGLEFDVVFLPEVIEKVTPHKRAALEADIEEERRAFYVAFTRAKESVHVFSPRERFLRQTTVSRFVNELM